MKNIQSATIPPGWVGGFEESNPAFAYPDPNLSSLPMLDNMANIGLLQRQQAVRWPEFSWQTIPGNENSRCFQMFAPDISRLGYTDTGRVYSIICPQQGACSPTFGCLNVEVTVTGQRGWANETDQEMAADMTVEGKIWFSPSSLENWKTILLWNLFNSLNLPFPSDKTHAIRVTTHCPGLPDQPIFFVRKGETTLFKSPAFAQHYDTAWAIGNLSVEIGPILSTGNSIADEFNTLVMEIFNFAKGNILQAGNILTWNLWFQPPTLVNQEEWRNHAEKWRQSIDADHGSPDGNGTEPRYFNGEPFNPFGGDGEKHLQAEEDKVNAFIKKYVSKDALRKAKLPRNAFLLMDK
ncbi:MAG: hypothetical protein GC192_22135 [Bacteroidetes bacterium]|nr:hypothetical protein [Bacteroidota bacterium]